MRQSDQHHNQYRIKIFVGGPIQWAFEDNGDFDPCIRAVLATVIDYFRSRGAQVFSAHVEEGFGASPVPNPFDIARRDHDWMLASDVYVAVLPHDASGRLLRSDGTHIEIGWASALGKPVLLLIAHYQEEAHLGSQLLKGLGSISPVVMADLNDTLTSTDCLWDHIETLCGHAASVEAR